MYKLTKQYKLYDLKTLDQDLLEVKPWPFERRLILINALMIFVTMKLFAQ